MNIKRCPWAKSPLDIQYHDKEWGKPLHSDKRLFELLLLETMQAGLSWSTVLAKREAFRQALDGFDATKIAAYGPQKLEELLANEGLIRNRLKIHSIVANAKAFLAVQQEFGTFDEYLWGFVHSIPIVNQFDDPAQVPTQTEISQAMSRDMKKRGFSFVGPVTCYAYMQAAGLVNDHMTWCSHYQP